MFGAIYIGLSGLNAYSDGLRAVSNNVSNLNTTGFKAADISFSDLFGLGSHGGLALNRERSGEGYGVGLNALSIDFSQGELRQTDRDLDLAVEGSGFLVLIDGDRTYYARTGNFAVDQEGYIVLGETDMRLAVIDDSGRPVAVSIDDKRTDPPVQTTRIAFADNLSSTATSYTIPDLEIFDARGERHEWTVDFTRTETEFDSWTVTVTAATGEIGTQTLRFAAGAVASDSTELVFAKDGEDFPVTFDFSNVTSFSSGTVSSLRAADIDGHAVGSITSISINAIGELEIAYSNQETLGLGAVALADFRDPQALEQRGNGLFAHDGYGQVQYLSAEDDRVGSILSRRLEASNVDLGAQFGDLILVQRGYQASSQIISVSNDMIQQLFGIRGQG
ncbi:flagellar hook protein FlgE [Pelagerythrobacter marensis]|uniref:Flagellar hook protein FlgE n=1 Tax=Pelagerythrobacter marensis TaxID=543877 RepID=A0A0G3X9U5_9SPHN|nr:flagellar hook-basal body complex protein [Pelagerythrobacter marensis]AKM07972.1 Flagellar hook protein FlgE [Pelagerythrobacter marensis]